MSDEATAFLYPFIEADERDAAGLVAVLAGSAGNKLADSASVRGAALDRCRSEVSRAARDLAARFAGGGRLFTMGNGGSATDAEGLAALFSDPPRGDPLPAAFLADDPAVVTALSNDVGFERVFSRQLIALARPEDCVVGFSTSGNSPNLVGAFEEASARGMLTIGLSGYDGGAMAMSDALDYCLVVRTDSVHRIQEAQEALAFELWSAVRQVREDPGSAGGSTGEPAWPT